MCYISLMFVFIALLIGCSSHPKITLEAIQKDIVGKSTDEGIKSWLFSQNEPREISIVEEKYDGNKAAIIIDMKTKDLPGKGWFAPATTHMAGKLRLNYEWIAKEWNLVRIENLTFKPIEAVKSATDNDGKVTKNTVMVGDKNQEDTSGCKEIYDIYKFECIEQKKCSQDDFATMVDWRNYESFSKSKRYKMKEFDSLCKRACQSFEVLGYDAFKSKVCGK